MLERQDAEAMAALVGRTPKKIEVAKDRTALVFWFEDGSACLFSHHQTCCEHVAIEDISGDLQDLVGHPLVQAKEDIDGADLCSPRWTFYTFRSHGGTVQVRWFGDSNGFYSTNVNVKFVDHVAERHRWMFEV